MNQSRRNRSLLLLVSSFMGRSLALDPNQKDLIAGYQAAESDFFKQHPSQIEMPLTTDLLSALTTAVEIVDPFIVSSSKILLGVEIPVILAISRANFLRVICHLLLESSDFAGPFGKTRVKASLKSPTTEELWRMGKDKVAELTFRAERHAQIPLEATPLELYMHRHYMPVQYRVSVKETEVEEDAPSKQQAKPLVSEHALSDNLTIASHLAKACGGEMHVQRPSEQQLVLSARFKLHTAGSI